jgi:hypothetical protein
MPIADIEGAAKSIPWYVIFITPPFRCSAISTDAAPSAQGTFIVNVLAVYTVAPFSIKRRINASFLRKM